jgi:hypothetical protein
MNPEQAKWQQDGESYKTSLDLTCQPDGSFSIESGSFRYEGSDPTEATQAFSRLIEHGQEQAQGGTTGS